MLGRVPTARRMATADPKRLLVSLVGVAAAIGLVLLLQGMWNGQLIQISAYEDRVGADLFVAQPDTEGLLGDVSVVPLAAVDQIRGLPEVDRADPVHLHATISELHGSKEFVFVAGSSPTGLGGPWELSAGRPAAAVGEAVVDASLAEKHALGVGDSFEMKGENFRVVGLSSQSRSWMAAWIFVTDESASRLTAAGETASYILVQAADPEQAATAIEKLTGLLALDPEEVARSDREVLAGIMESPIKLMILIALAAGTLVITLTVYSGVVERFREYGIVKAIGAGRFRLLVIVLGQTLALAIAGSVVGFLMYLGGARLVSELRPQFWFSLAGRDVLTLFAGAMVMAALAAILPARQLARLDPASVYRGD